MSERHGGLKGFLRKNFRRGPDGRRGRLGQISLLIIFSLLPMFTLFAFSVNIGMMVNAKIALQNATDLAAYAGAATQARQLTQISHLNYYMRMIYKKFLYKYYVIGNIALRCFPGAQNSSLCHDTSGDFNWINPAGSGTGTFPGVPLICISLSNNSNPCQLSSAVHVVQPPPCNPAEPACGALQGAAGNIAAIQQASCSKGSFINSKVAGLWLYATNYASQNPGVQQLQGIVNNDIGLITEEELTYQRIINLVDAINSTPQQISSLSQAQNLPNNNQYDAANVERTVLAYSTLMNGLNAVGDGYTYDPSTVTMNELLPNTNMLVLKPLQIQLTVLAALMEGSGPGGSGGPAANGSGCLMTMNAIPVSGSGPGNGLMVGVARDFTTPTPVYYAIQTGARARLLFNPFPIGGPSGDIQMTAYAAAMPFGSRIGPDFSSGNDQGAIQNEFTKFGTPSDGNGVLPPGVPNSAPYPHMMMDASHSTADVKVLRSIYEAMAQATNQSSGLLLSQTSQNVNQTLVGLVAHIAMLPDIAEIGRYNIPVDTERYADPSGSGGQRTFFSYYAPPGGSPSLNISYTMWAPFISVAHPTQFSNTITTLVNELADLAGKVGGNLSPTLSNMTSELKDEAMQGINSLLGPQGSGGLVDNQGNNVFRMADPLSTAWWAAQNIPFPSIPGKVTSPNPAVIGSQLATSWVTQNDSGYMNTGRDGYSVKLVSFQNLLNNPGVLSNEVGVNWQRPSPGGNTSELSSLHH